MKQYSMDNPKVFRIFVQTLRGELKWHYWKYRTSKDFRMLRVARVVSDKLIVEVYTYPQQPLSPEIALQFAEQAKRQLEENNYAYPK